MFGSKIEPGLTCLVSGLTGHACFKSVEAHICSKSLLYICHFPSSSCKSCVLGTTDSLTLRRTTAIMGPELRGKSLILTILLCSGVNFMLVGYDQGLFGGILAGVRFQNMLGNPGPTMSGLVTAIVSITRTPNCHDPS